MSKQNKNRGYHAKGKGGKGKGDYRTDNNSSKYNSGKTRAQDYIGEQNDPKWYTHNSRLIQDVTKIPFNAQVGRPIPIGVSELNPPSIMTLAVHTCPGIAESASDGVNIAGQAVFMKLRKDLSTYAKYAQADVTMFILKMVDIFAEYAHLTRMFGVANLYSTSNLSYNNTLLRAMGLTEGSISLFRKNFNDYRAQFNNLIYKAQSLFMPAAFPIIDRHLWMFSNYFYDHQDPRAQLYMYVPTGHWTLDETGENGTELKYNTGNRTSVLGLLNEFDASIESIRSSDSMLMIMSDLRRAFSDSTPWTFSFIDENYTVLPTYSTEVLSQIENTVVLPGDPSNDIITQDVMANTIKYQPKYTNDYMRYWMSGDGPAFTYADAIKDIVLNMHWVNPTSDDIIVATRNVPTLEPESSVVNADLRITSCGSDFITGMMVWTYEATTGVEYDDVMPYVFTVVPSYVDTGLESNISIIRPLTLQRYLMFDWAPRCLMYDFTRDSEDNLVFDPTSVQPVVEIDNYSVISTDLMYRIHNNVILSMWNVPELGNTYN